MMRFYFLLATAAFFFGRANAQTLSESRTSSHFTFIYRITNEQAKKLYTDRWEFDRSYLTTLFDFYPTDSAYRKDLPIGHYVFVKASERSIEGELHSVGDLGLNLLNNYRDLIFVLTDSAGQEVTNAEVYIRHRKILYDAKTSTYRLPKSNRQGLLSVTHGAHTSFFELDRAYNNGFFVRTGRKVINFFPVRMVVSPVFYIKNNVRNIIQGNRPYLPGILYRIAKPFRPKQHTGYIAFNKPMYKPGDTVRLKAFITTHKGQPFRNPVAIALEQRYPANVNLTLGTTAPYRPGAFTYEFILSDTMKLRLDEDCFISLSGKKNRSLVSDRFAYEDYELNTNTYAIRTENSNDGRPSALYLKGTDSNDMPLFDVRAEIILKPADVKRFSGRSVFVGDTLWRHTVKLEPIGETKVILPDSVMPDVSMEYTAEVVFLNTDNERIVKTAQLSYSDDVLPVAITLSGDSLMIASTVYDPSFSEVTLRTQFWNGETATPISLPFREKLNSFAKAYEVSHKGKKRKIDVSDQDDQLIISASRTRDSVFVTTENPRKLALRYFLFQNRQLVASGNGDNIRIARPSGSTEAYNLSVQFVWGGESQNREYNIPFDRSHLDITIDHAPVVHPGETTEFTIAVKDALGKAVADADVTAFAFTKKFAFPHIASVPNLAKPQKKRIIYNQFSETDQDQDLSTFLDFAYWRKVLGLDSISFYQFMYPDSGYFEERTKADVPQFAPFVVDWGLESISVIYVDNVPVYYRDAAAGNPYSFAVMPGIHTIALRTRTALITVPDVRIDSAQKLIFSVNIRKPPRHIQVTAMPSKFTEAEINRLARHFIALRPGSGNRLSYFVQGSRCFLTNTAASYNFGRPTLAGPFFPGPVTYSEKDGFRLTFDYEPFSTYEFRENILKIRPFDAHAALKGSGPGRYFSETPRFSDRVLTASTLEKHWNDNMEFKVRLFHRFPDLKSTSSKLGKLTLEYVSPGADVALTRATFIINIDQPDEYYVLPHLPVKEFFERGRYEAVILLHDKRYIRQDSIEIHAFGTNYYRVDGKEIHEADSISARILDMIERWSKPDNYIQRDRELELQRLRSLYYVESSAASTFSHIVTGRITDSNGEPIPGANVLIKGSAVGTITTGEGYFHLKCPSQGMLVISFIGYQTQEVPIPANGITDVTLAEDVQQLSEVVVVGYAVQSRRNLTGTVTTLQGRVAGVQASGTRPLVGDSIAMRIRGITTLKNGGEPMVILDGRIVRLADVDRTLVTAMEAISGAEAVALYGSRAANGVLLLSTKAGATKTYLKEMSKSVISVTPTESQPGNELRKNFRDYAFWQPKLRTGADGKVKFRATFPDDITGWNAYALGMATKRRTGQTSSAIQSFKPLVAQISHPLFLIEGDHAMGFGKITNYSREQIRVNRRIKINGNLIQEETVALTDSKIDTLALNANGPDSISVEYGITFKNYRDGELRKVPVLRRGVMETTGMFLALNDDTTFTVKAAPGEKVTIYAQADVLDVLIDELQYLGNYPYGCNEQTASKLKALLVKKDIKQFQKEKFEDDNMVRKLIRKLTETQNADGSWSWWKGGSGETWITLHVIRTLLRAEKDGYRVDVDKEGIIDYLENNLTSLQTRVRLEVMNFLAEQGQALRVGEFIDSIKVSPRTTMHEKLLAERLRLKQGQAVDWAWLNSMQSGTIKGNAYWGDKGNSVFDNAIVNTLLVYEMAIRDERNTDYIRKIENYFLEQRRRHWRNTYESSLILEHILPSILKRGNVNEKPALVLNGPISKRIDTFPFKWTNTSGDLTVAKKGGAPVYFTAYTEEWNANPVATGSDFSVRTSFDSPGTTLSTGKPVQLHVDVEVRADAEYVMIEVPIPAGCSYRTKSESRLNGEVYREYYQHKTNIYCSRLKKGTYRYTIELVPRYTGMYTLNPAVAECMYFPTLFGRDGMKEISIR